MKLINHTSEIMAKLKAEGRVRIMNTQEDLALFSAINKHMAEVRREFIIKSFESEKEAEKIIFNT